MNKYDLTDEEDLLLYSSVRIPGGRSLYEYLCELPLEELKAYPQKDTAGGWGGLRELPKPWQCGTTSCTGA